ncbi:MAG: hypothetical protein PVH61_09400 [Candidatus Aminicenantes bacterium]|jgi:hypothetical protein
MSKNSYAEQINLAEVMYAGLVKFKERLSRRGIDDAFVEELKFLKETAVDINNDQESMKAQQKKKTEELNQAMDKLGEKVSEAKKLVKLDIEPELWKEFGIWDKQ